jgi:hypothetical protein
MSRDKQTEKVSKQRREYLKFKPFADDLRNAESWCELDGVLNRYQTVKNLSKMGYRKSSEVAREIFEEIEELLNLQAKIVCETRDKYRETDEPILSFIAMLDGRIYSLRVVEEHIAELKKKYTESEKDNGEV